MHAEIPDHRQGRAGLLEAREHQADRVLHLLIGIQHQLPGRIEDQPDRRAHAQLALFGLGQLATQESVAQPMEFRLAHGTEKQCTITHICYTFGEAELVSWRSAAIASAASSQP